jgi:hypothetical protein
VRLQGQQQQQQQQQQPTAGHPGIVHNQPHNANTRLASQQTFVSDLFLANELDFG